MKHKGWVKGEDVRVGDVILEYRGYETGPVSTWNATIRKTEDLKGEGDDCISAGTMYYGGRRKLEWLVERDELDFGPAISRTPTMVFNGSKKVNEYPDFCTRCGLPAYVGLFEIAHKNEAAAKDCPARRK